MKRRLDDREWPRVTSSYRALDLCFAVRSMGDDAADYLEQTLAPLATDEAAQHLYSVVDNGERYKGRYAVYFDGQRISRSPSESIALSFLLWHINRAAVVESQRYLLIHASAAVYKGSALLFPAPAGSGKTTLIAGLVQRGFGYLTDEAVAIDPLSLNIDPYPKALSIDHGSWEVLANLRPEPDPRFASYRGEKWHVAPDSVRVGAVAAPCRPNLVISPRYEPGAPTKLQPITRAETVLLLAQNAFNFAHHKGDGLRTLAAAVRGCAGYRLTIGSLADACHEVSAVAEHLSVGG